MICSCRNTGPTFWAFGVYLEMNRKGAGMLNQKYLVFDNYPFKLAVVQQLMYEQELLENRYTGGDQYFERYTDAAEASDEESIRRLKPYIMQGTQFFRDLNIPLSLADEITELYVGAESNVYYQINPQWLDFDEYFEDGKDFDIMDISEREIRQFPKLASITFNMYHTPPEELVKKIKGWGIEVHLSD